MPRYKGRSSKYKTDGNMPRHSKGSSSNAWIRRLIHEDNSKNDNRGSATPTNFFIPTHDPVISNDEPIDLSEDLSTKIEEDVGRICNFCGMQVDETVITCPNCNNEISEVVLKQETVSIPGKRSYKPKFISIDSDSLKNGVKIAGVIGIIGAVTAGIIYAATERARFCSNSYIPCDILDCAEDQVAIVDIDGDGDLDYVKIVYSAGFGDYYRVMLYENVDGVVSRDGVEIARVYAPGVIYEWTETYCGEDDEGNQECVDYYYETDAAFDIGDINGDGRLDLVIAGINETFLVDYDRVLIYYGQSDGSFSTNPDETHDLPRYSIIKDAEDIRNLMVFDNNGDGRADIAYMVDARFFGQGDFVLYVLENNGSGFEAPQEVFRCNYNDIPNLPQSPNYGMSATKQGGEIKVLYAGSDGNLKEVTLSSGGESRAPIINSSLDKIIIKDSKHKIDNGWL